MNINQYIEELIHVKQTQIDACMSRLNDYTAELNLLLAIKRTVRESQCNFTEKEINFLNDI